MASALMARRAPAANQNLALSVAQLAVAYSKSIRSAEGNDGRPATAQMSNGMIAVAYQEMTTVRHDLDTHIMLVNTATGTVLADRLFNATSGTRQSRDRRDVGRPRRGLLRSQRQRAGGRDTFRRSAPRAADEFANRLERRPASRRHAPARGGDTLYGAGNCRRSRGRRGRRRLRVRAQRSRWPAGRDRRRRRFRHHLRPYFNNGAKSVDFTEAASITSIEQLTIAGDVIFARRPNQGRAGEPRG